MIANFSANAVAAKLHRTKRNLIYRGDKMETFENQITNIITYYEPNGIEEITGNITAYWNYDMEMRSWGLRGAISYISKLVGSLFYNYEDGREEEVDINSLGFEIVTNGFEDKKISDDICPSDIEVNYKDKTITVNF